MARIAAVGINNDFAAGQSAVTHRAAGDEATSRVDIDDRIVIHQFHRNHRADDMLHNSPANFIQRDVRAVLGGNHNGINAHWAIIVIIFHGDLRFTIRQEIRQRTIFPDFCQTACQLVGQRNRQRHQLRRFIARVAKHHALIACAIEVIGILFAIFKLQGMIHTQSDIRRLTVDCG